MTYASAVASDPPARRSASRHDFFNRLSVPGHLSRFPLPSRERERAEIVAATQRLKTHAWTRTGAQAKSDQLFRTGVSRVRIDILRKGTIGPGAGTGESIVPQVPGRFGENHRVGRTLVAQSAYLLG